MQKIDNSPFNFWLWVFWMTDKGVKHGQARKLQSGKWETRAFYSTDIKSSSCDTPAGWYCLTEGDYFAKVHNR